MIYRSNLTCPDLTPHFKHLHSRPMGHSFGHDVPSDWADKDDDDPVFGLYKRCGLWTHDEAAILWNVARKCGPKRIDIGAHTGWTTAHAAIGSAVICAVDPMLRVGARGCFGPRFVENTRDIVHGELMVFEYTSQEFFRRLGDTQLPTDMFCIDGDHEPGKPLEDALNAAKHLADTGVIIFHDFVGLPVREAVLALMGLGFKARVYYTPHGVACCWRGDFVPPDHVPDPEVKRQLLDGRLSDFNFTRCE